MDAFHSEFSYCQMVPGYSIFTANRTKGEMRRSLLIAAKLFVSVGLLYFALSRINFEALGDRLNKLDPKWIVIAIAIGLVQVGAAALRWQRIAVVCGAALQSAQAVRFVMIAAFFNQVLPSTVGGDAARIIMLARTGVGWWRSMCTVLLDRFIGVLTLAALVAGGLYWSFGLIQDPIGRTVLLLIGAGSLGAGVLFLIPVVWRVLGRLPLMRYLSELSTLARRVLLSRSSPLIALLSFLIHGLTVLIAWTAAHAVAARLGLVDAFLLVLPVMLIATIPISIAGWGVRESALVLAFSYAGLPESDGLIVSVVLGGVMFAVGIIGGLVWLASPESLRKSAIAEMPPPR